MKNFKYLALLISLLFVMNSCDEDNPFDGEQHIKELFLVGAAENIRTQKIAYGKGEQEAYVSVAMGGSKLPDKDFTVTLSSQNSVIEWYNKKFKYLPDDIHYQLLDNQYYSIPSYDVVYKSNTSYTLLPVKINPEGLHCDSLYAITFKVESTTDYAINKSDSALILSFEFVNDYSGLYMLDAMKYEVNAHTGEQTKPSMLSGTRSLKAVNENIVRFYNELKAENVVNIKDNCINIEFDPSGDLLFSGWENLEITEHSSTYDADKELFNLDYKYVVNGITYQIIGTLTKQKEL